MSLSNPDLTNPAKRFFTWKGSDGDLVWYDKEKKQNVVIELPFEFIVLDELSTITGFSDADQSGFWSNETRSILRDELTVKTAKGTRYVGKYKNDQGIVQMPQGAKYAKSIYIAYKESTSFAIGNIKASGAALTSWIEFSQTCKVQNGKIALVGAEEVRKGATVYQVPTFEHRHFEGDEYDIAVELDKELQVYLSQYLAKNTTIEIEEIDVWPSGSTGANNNISSETKEEESPRPAAGALEAVKEYEEAHPKKELNTSSLKKTTREWKKLGKAPQLDLNDPEAASLYQSIATHEQEEFN